MIKFRRSTQIYITLIVVFLSVLNLKGQISDTAWIKSNHLFITRDTTIFFENDTFLIVPVDLKYKVKIDSKVKTESFYDSIYVKSQKNWVKSELYGFVFRKPKYAEQKINKKLENSQDPFNKHKGKIIGNIHISNLGFLYSFQQGDSAENHNLLNRSISNTHLTTHKKIIQKNLTFNTNDDVNPFVLSENERLLRQLPSLEDARITIVERTPESDTVDIIVSTIDVYPFSIDGAFASFKDFKIGFYNTNFLGSGIEWKNMFIYKTKYEPDWGFEGRFKYNNVRGSFINLALYYESIEPYKELRVVANRNLTIPTVNTGGAIDLGLQSFTDKVGPSDSLIDTLVSSHYQDYWLGQKLFNRNFSNQFFIVKARYYREVFTERPYTVVDSNYRYHNKDQFFGSLSYHNVRYMKSKYILGFGVTEDVPFGLIIQATGGYEISEFFSCPYLQFDIAYGKYFNKAWYFQIYSSYGGYVKNQRVVNEVFKTDIKSFSNLFKLGKYNFREFARLNYTLGDDLFDQKSLKLNKYIQGLSNDNIYGTSRLVLGLETVIFTPWYFYGFKVASFTLLEAGFLGPTKDLLASNNFYTGIGSGFNIRNESLVFSTMSFRVSYYPGSSNYNSFWGFSFSFSEPKFFDDMKIKKPGRVKYD